MAAGVGITLTKAHTMVICDYDWTPANMTQVEDRICRTGQGEHCNIFYICHEGAILDQIFLQMITDKSSNIDRVVDAAENTVDLVRMKHSDPAGMAKNSFLAALKARILNETSQNGEIDLDVEKEAKMAQTGVFITINGIPVEEVFPGIPDHDELIEICEDQGYFGNERRYPEDYISVEYEKVEFGAGEYGQDRTWSDSELLYLYQSRNQPDCPAEVTTVEEGQDTVEYDELRADRFTSEREKRVSSENEAENEEESENEQNEQINRFHL